jgi:16S rRNA (guanine(1405)-N(7))-methyltransferase
MNNGYTDEVEDFLNKVKVSRKYRDICEDTIRDVIRSALPRYGKKSDAIKAARTKLHRIQASYLGNIAFEREIEDIGKFHLRGDTESVKSVCLKLMKEHASTKERIPILNRFYDEIFSVTGVPKKILDVACGVHPFSIPWMKLPDNVLYWAYEIDNKLVSCLNKYFVAIGMEPMARMQDVICNPSLESGDIAFVMKMVPCLERREKGISIKLLKMLKVRYLVVSFPIKSLSGRSKHMPSFYTQFFYNMVDGLGWEIKKMPISDELVFVADKGEG